MTQDTAISILLQAKDNASATLRTVQQRVQQAQTAIGRTGQQIRTQMTTAVDLSRASTFAFAGAVGLLTTALFTLESQTQTAAAQIAGMSGLTSDSIPKITGQLRDLAKENDASMADVSAALKSVYTDFKIFDVTDPNGIAQMLLDWQDATGSPLALAGETFKSIILTYFGPDADLNKVLPEVMDMLIKVWYLCIHIKMINGKMLIILLAQDQRPMNDSAVQSLLELVEKHITCQSRPLAQCVILR